MLAYLWECHPNHKNLLPASMADSVRVLPWHTNPNPNPNPNTDPNPNPNPIPNTYTYRLSVHQRFVIEKC